MIATGIRYTYVLRKQEQYLLTKQREWKRRKHELLIQNQVLKAQDDYIKSLLLIEVYYSEAGWKSVEEVDTE